MPKGNQSEPLVKELLDFFWKNLPPVARERLFPSLVEPPVFGQKLSPEWQNSIRRHRKEMPNTQPQGDPRPDVPNPEGWRSKIPWTPPPDDPTPLPVPHGQGVLPDRNRMPLGGTRNGTNDTSDDSWWYEKLPGSDGIVPASAKAGQTASVVEDGIADAIIGAVFLLHKVSRIGRKAPHPKSDEVFQVDPNAKAPPVRTREQSERMKFYSGSADNMERQAKRYARNIAEAQGEDEEWTN